MTEKLKEHRSYLIGLFVTALVGASALQLVQPSSNLPVIVDILIMTLIVVWFCFLLSGLIRGVVWIFTKDFNLTKFIRTSVVICLIWTLTSLISVMTGLAWKVDSCPTSKTPRRAGNTVGNSLCEYTGVLLKATRNESVKVKWPRFFLNSSTTKMDFHSAQTSHFSYLCIVSVINNHAQKFPPSAVWILPGIYWPYTERVQGKCLVSAW